MTALRRPETLDLMMSEKGQSAFFLFQSISNQLQVSFSTVLMHYTFNLSIFITRGVHSFFIKCRFFILGINYSCSPASVNSVDLLEGINNKNHLTFFFFLPCVTVNKAFTRSFDDRCGKTKNKTSSYKRALRALRQTKDDDIHRKYAGARN